jgi:O-antigen/teichoic acid export membrane protein
MLSMTKHDPSSSSGSAGDMLFGIGGKLLYAATRVALPPLALAHMGLAEYGLWAACFVLVGYLGMAASGFTLVYLRQTAQHHARGDVVAIGRLLSTGMLAMGALTLVLMAGLWFALPGLLDLFSVHPAHRDLATQLWLGTAAVFLADMSLGAFANVLHAVGRVRQEQKVWVLAFLLEAVLIVGGLQAGWGVQALLVAFALRYLFSASANAWLAHRALPGLRLSWRRFDRGLLRGFFGYGAAMQASGLIATALHSADRLLAGALIGPQATALMDLAGKLPVTAAGISSSASNVAVSASARHDVQGQAQALQQVYRDASRITVAGLALTLPFLAWFAQPLALAWLGRGEAQAALAPLIVAAALGLHAHMLTGPANAVRRGCGRLDADFFYHGMRATALAAAATWWWWASQAGGLSALATALALAQATAAAIFLALAHRRLRGSWEGLASLVLLPTLAAHALAASLWLALRGVGLANTPTNRIEALWTLALPTLLWLPAAAALLGALLLSPAERQSVKSRLRRVLRPAPWRTA